MDINTPNHNYDELLDLFRRAEKQNRWLRRGCIAAVLVTSVLLLSGAEKAKPTVIEAERFVLRNSEGTKRGAFGLEDGNATIVLLDQDGKPGLKMVVGDEETTLHVTTPKRKRQFSFVLRKEDARFSVSDEKENVLAQLRSNPEEHGLFLADSDGNKHVTLLTKPDGDGGIIAIRDDEKPRIGLTATHKKRAQITMGAPDGHPRLVLLVDPNGAGIALANPKRKKVAELMVSGDQGGMFTLRHSDETPGCSLAVIRDKPVLHLRNIDGKTIFQKRQERGGFTRGWPNRWARRQCSTRCDFARPQ